MSEPIPSYSSITAYEAAEQRAERPTRADLAERYLTELDRTREELRLAREEVDTLRRQLRGEKGAT